MSLFLSDEDFARCSHDPSVITQKTDAFITELYDQLHTQKAQSLEKDDEIERLSQEVSELRKSKTQLMQLIEHKDVEIMEKNSSIKGYLDKIAALTDTATKEQIGEETSAKIHFDPDVILMVHNMVKFNGLPDENPYTHIANFQEICDLLEFCGTFKTDGASIDAIRLRLFPFTLRDKAQLWRRSLPVGSITTWDPMAEKFLSKYFPPSKKAKLRKDIASFLQHDGESLYETWERFKDLLWKCPHHGLQPWSQVEIFYNGLYDETRKEIDGATLNIFNSETPEAAFDLIDKRAVNCHWRAKRNGPSTHAVHQIDESTSLTAQIEALSRKMDQIQVNALQISCELCGGPHISRDCHQGNMFASDEQVDYMGNQVHPQNYTYNNTSQRNHANSSWQASSISQRPTGFQQHPPYQQEHHQNQHQYY